jgi:hypothetical protein
MNDASFDRAISEHLARCERNKRLERQMPLDRYRDQLDGGSERRTAPSTPPESVSETKAAVDAPKEQWLESESFWDTTGERPLPEFDWGDD